jgi:hypothetical protein
MPKEIAKNEIRTHKLTIISNNRLTNFDRREKEKTKDAHHIHVSTNTPICLAHSIVQCGCCSSSLPRTCPSFMIHSTF